jgi:CheY-like chemotaxis protein
MGNSKPPSILFVDDEPEQARTYADGLRLRGLEVTIAAGVAEARAEFHKAPFPYALVVLDLWMKDVGDLRSDQNVQGFQTGALLFQEFRRKFGRQEPVIILSNVIKKLDDESMQGTERVERYDKGETRPSDLAQTIFRMLEQYPTSAQAE